MTTTNNVQQPITFVLKDFETQFRLSNNAETWYKSVTSQQASFALDLTLNLEDFSSVFMFTTDDIYILQDNVNDQMLEFITDVRKWGNLVTSFSNVPAYSSVLTLTNYTTDPNVSAVQAFVSWFTH